MATPQLEKTSNHQRLVRFLKPLEGVGVADADLKSIERLSEHAGPPVVGIVGGSQLVRATVCER